MVHRLAFTPDDNQVSNRSLFNSSFFGVLLDLGQALQVFVQLLVDFFKQTVLLSLLQVFLEVTFQLLLETGVRDGFFLIGQTNRGGVLQTFLGGLLTLAVVYAVEVVFVFFLLRFVFDLNDGVGLLQDHHRFEETLLQDDRGNTLSLLTVSTNRSTPRVEHPEVDTEPFVLALEHDVDLAQVLRFNVAQRRLSTSLTQPLEHVQQVVRLPAFQFPESLSINATFSQTQSRKRRQHFR